MYAKQDEQASLKALLFSPCISGIAAHPSHWVGAWWAGVGAGVLCQFPKQVSVSSSAPPRGPLHWVFIITPILITRPMGLKRVLKITRKGGAGALAWAFRFQSPFACSALHKHALFCPQPHHKLFSGPMGDCSPGGLAGAELGRWLQYRPQKWGTRKMACGEGLLRPVL